MICYDTAATTVFSDNVCYGDQTFGARLEGGNMTVTGNVFIAPQLYWRGTLPLTDSGGGANGGGISFYNPQPNVTVSGNYIEACGWALYLGGFDGVAVPGLVITHNTIVANSSDNTTNPSVVNLDNGLPAVMNGNQWAWLNSFPNSQLTSPQFFVPGYTYDSYNSGSVDTTFLAWAQKNGYEQDSAGQGVAPGVLLNAQAYDADLGGGDGEVQTNPPSLAVAMGDFRGYATAQISSYGQSADGAADGVAVSEIGGTTTRGADGTVSPAAPQTYAFTAGTPLIVSAAHGLLAGMESELVVALCKLPLTESSPSTRTGRSYTFPGSTIRAPTLSSFRSAMATAARPWKPSRWARHREGDGGNAS